MEKYIFNDNLKICIKNIPNGVIVLENIRILYNNNISFTKKDSVFYHIPEIKPFTNIASFDLDWTLSYNEKHLFPKNEDDIFIIPERREVLVKLIKRGYTLCIFTNQYAISVKEKEKKITRVSNFLKKIQLPIFTFISTEKDNYRKPNIGMFNLFKHIVGDLDLIFYSGDALGRPQDFSDSDKVFSENIRAELITPEELFPISRVPLFFPTNELVIFVGMPGSGKTEYYKKYLADHIHINQDTLKNKKNVFKMFYTTIKSGISIVIDGTNPSQEDREVFYKSGLDHNYKIKVLYFIKNGTGWNKLRNNPVPNIIYHIYFKKLVPPTTLNTSGEIYYIY